MSVLSMLGLGVPDPNKYLNQTTITDQSKSVMAALTTTVNAIGSASTMLKLVPGLPSSVTRDLASLKSDASALVSKAAKMTPASIESARSSLEMKLETIQARVAQENATAKSNAILNAVNTVKKRITVINDDDNIPDTIKAEYTAVLDISGSAEDILNGLANAEDILLVHENKEFNGVRLLRRAWRSSVHIIFVMLCVLAAILGGTIISNAYSTEVFWGIRVYYFFYGMAFFPISLLYGIIKSPPWVATILPLYPISGPPKGVVEDLFGYQEGASSSLRLYSLAIVAALLGISYSRGTLKPVWDSFMANMGR